MIRNIFDIPRSFALSAVVSALVAMLVGYSGPLLLVVQAAEAAHLTHAQTSSWIWAISVGTGTCALLLSLWYRNPVLVAWPTATVALLVTTLPNYTLPQAIGAYLVANFALMLLGISGLFGRVMKLIPLTIIAGMMGGVLLRFGVNVFKSAVDEPLLVLSMTLIFLLLKRFQFRAPSVGVLLVGFAIALLRNQVHVGDTALQLTVPAITWPEFSWNAILGIGLPTFILALASQHAPGIGVLRAFGYDTPPDGPIFLTGFASLITAFFGSHGLALSAITAAICVSPDSHPDKDKRYVAGVFYGFWYILFGLFGATAVSLFTGVPKALVATIAGLSLLGAISTAMTNAMSEPSERDAALIAFLLTASEVSFFGIGAPFWGLLAGVVANYVLKGWKTT